MITPFLRKMIEADINSVVKIHEKSFQGFFLEKMGYHFLKAYYKIILSYEDSISYVAIDENNEIVGFVVGFVNPKEFYNKFQKSRVKLIFPIMIGIIFRPYIIKEILGNIKRVSSYQNNNNNNNNNDDGKSDNDKIELSSIAVKTSSKGIGSELLQIFINKSWQLGLKKIILTTDQDNNHHANAFYLKNGFRQTGVEIRNNRKLIKYELVNQL